jgi:hypothetical protein
VKTDPETTVKMCFELLDGPEVENALRIGDVYALMVEWFHSQGDFPQARDLTQRQLDLTWRDLAWFDSTWTWPGLARLEWTRLFVTSRASRHRRTS